MSISVDKPLGPLKLGLNKLIEIQFTMIIIIIFFGSH